MFKWYSRRMFTPRTALCTLSINSTAVWSTRVARRWRSKRGMRCRRGGGGYGLVGLVCTRGSQRKHDHRCPRRHAAEWDNDYGVWWMLRIVDAVDSGCDREAGVRGRCTLEDTNTGGRIACKQRLGKRRELRFDRVANDRVRSLLPCLVLPHLNFQNMANFCEFCVSTPPPSRPRSFLLVS
jgi:hypothetical protein